MKILNTMKPIKLKSKQSTIIYAFIQWAVIAVCLVMFVKLFQVLMENKTSVLFSVGLLAQGVLLFLLLHFVRMVRYYLILSESYIPIYEFTKLYLRTSIVTLLIPFKLGEFYRIYAYSKATKSVTVGILSVVTQVFFDLIVTVAIIMLGLILNHSGSALILFLFTTGITFAILIYLIFPQTYLYLNKYFVTKRNRKRDINVLKILHFSNRIYTLEKAILKGKAGMIFILSFIVWTIEYFVFNTVTHLFNMPYDVSVFSAYISNLLLNHELNAALMLSVYVVAGVPLLLIVLGLLSLVKTTRRS